MKLTIIIPCYNERATLEGTVARVHAAVLPHDWEREVIAVDDGSSDGTAEVLHTLEQEGNLRALFHERNRGKGAAIKTALKVATGDYIVIQDADAEYDPADIAKLLEATSRADSVFGSRNLGTNNVPYNAIYFYGGLLTTKVFNIVFGTHLSDIATCYKLFPRRFIPQLVASDHNDFVFDAVALTLTLVQGGSIVEVPISYEARSKQDGKKLNVRHASAIVAAILLGRFGLSSAAHVRSLARIFRFLATGTLAAIANISVLYLFTQYGNIWYIYSSVFAFFTSFAFSFFLQKYWVFRSSERAKIKRQLPLHLATAFFNLGINTLLLYFFVEYTHLWYVFAQLIASALIAFESFAVFRWIFR